MINANELRLNNWVRYVSRDVQVKELRHDNMITTCEFVIAGNEYFDPIPLTPQILEACGFEKHEDSNDFWTFFVLPTSFQVDQSHDPEISTGVSDLFYWGDSYKTNEIKSLHQLQNLYFALTGNELTYNPTTINQVK